MVNDFPKVLAIAGLVLAGIGADAVSGDKQFRENAETAPESGTVQIKSVQVEAPVKTSDNGPVSSRATASARASASASSRASASSEESAAATMGEAGFDCFADAMATAEVDGQRIRLRDSKKFTNRHGPCHAEASAEARAGGNQQEND